MTDPDDIVSLAVNGITVREIAAVRGMTEAEVRAMIDQQAARCFEGEHLRREFLLEARRLRQLGQKYYALAMAGDGDVAAAAIYIKASERLATLSCMNHPIGYAVQLVQSDPPVQPTSTDLIQAAIDRVRGKITTVVDGQIIEKDLPASH